MDQIYLDYLAFFPHKNYIIFSLEINFSGFTRMSCAGVIPGAFYEFIEMAMLVKTPTSNLFCHIA